MPLDRGSNPSLEKSQIADEGPGQIPNSKSRPPQAVINPAGDNETGRNQDELGNPADDDAAGNLAPPIHNCGGFARHRSASSRSKTNSSSTTGLSSFEAAQPIFARGAKPFPLHPNAQRHPNRRPHPNDTLPGINVCAPMPAKNSARRRESATPPATSKMMSSRSDKKRDRPAQNHVVERAERRKNQRSHHRSSISR